jgi:hypothetical protein
MISLNPIDVGIVEKGTDEDDVCVATRPDVLLAVPEDVGIGIDIDIDIPLLGVTETVRVLVRVPRLVLDNSGAGAVAPSTSPVPVEFCCVRTGTWRKLCWRKGRNDLLMAEDDSHDVVAVALPPKTEPVPDTGVGVTSETEDEEEEVPDPGIPVANAVWVEWADVLDDGLTETVTVFLVVRVVRVVLPIVVVASVLVSLSELVHGCDRVTVWVWVTVTGLVTVMESVIVMGIMADGRLATTLSVTPP